MKYFIDTNFFLDLFERKNTDSISKFESICGNNSEFFYSGLVYAEALRKAPEKLLDANNNEVLDKDGKSILIFEELKAAFDNFECLEITRSIFFDAKKLARYCYLQKIKATKGRCELIDFVHFVTSKHYNLEMLTRDSDMEKLEQAWNDFIKP